MEISRTQKNGSYTFKIITFYSLGQDKMMDKLNLTKEEKGKRFWGW